MPTTKARSSKAKSPKPPRKVEADDLVRQAAGNYVSGDDRFEVRQSDATWYVVDREQRNEFGQELIHGPFGSLRAARAAMPGARDVKPLLRSRPRPRRAPEKKAEPKPQPTWIDRLPRDEAAEVRKLIRAVEAAGIHDAEALVRRDRQGLQPVVASTLLQQSLAASIDGMPEKDRALARKLIAKLGDVVSASEKVAGPLPGWALYELGPDREPTKRRLRLGG